MEQYAVEMREIVKTFGPVHAVSGASFNLIPGEIHSLIGENGAGKSTMMKLLYGIYSVDGGTVAINGKILRSLTPRIAIENGVGMVHQEFMLVDELTVLENIILGFEPKRGPLIDFVKAKANIQEYVGKYHMDIQINKRINQISVGEAQRVEIIKILSRGANTIILDEPTGVLTPQEARKLFEILLNLKAAGKSIIFISHKLNEVMEISDRVTVMRQSKVIDTVQKKETSPRELSKMMVGREVFLNIKRKEANTGDSVLTVENLWTSGEKELSKIRGVSFDVKAGEIVGVAGVDGNGQSELVEAIAGIREVERGKISLAGLDITGRSPRFIRDAGLTHIPEDRNTRGLNRAASVADNLIVNKARRSPFSKFGFVMNAGAVASYSEELIRKFDIRPPRPDMLTTFFSGGNAQKVVVAREVTESTRLLIAAQPTRGIDIGAIEAIRVILQEVKSLGVGVLLVSVELEEILSLSDRIVVLSEGTISGILPVEEASEENLGLLMLAGSRRQTDMAAARGGPGVKA
ncbi:MAG: ABC transporter ATP-binding protein [Treponema sp.]|jgi:simple sugar transport system ATP-binding protein|nr:ABC transporter ATP-binding protein [Treponema sp.]